jgi:hypothetical protein
VYVRRQPRNFLIFVEVGRGPSNVDVGQMVLNSNPLDPSARPDLQVQSNRDLGNGSRAVCDKDSPDLGGIPGVDPPDYDLSSQFVADALNDFACRFVAHNRSDEACTLGSAGIERFVVLQSEVQFCFEPVVGSEVAFPAGDTILTVRVRNIRGGLSDPAQIVIRVE